MSEIAIKPHTSVAESLSAYTQLGKSVPVSLSNEIVRLLSDQLYQSPLKAIEELVVNSYDADAHECRIFVPTISTHLKDMVVVYDNGIGMGYEGLVNLWQIGRSNKRSEEIERRSSRRQIGKFGIGKLAAFAIAHKLTYISKSENEILSVTINFEDFSSSPSGGGTQIELPVRKIVDWNTFVSESELRTALVSACVDVDALDSDSSNSWTVVVLESLKDESENFQIGRLTWVLSTAMPLKNDFRLYLNCAAVSSSKEEYSRVVDINLAKLPSERLDSLNKKTGDDWRVEGGLLKSDSFPAGITGSAIMTDRMLSGKSDDIERSHGFFIRVRERLVNEDSPLFGLTALTHGRFGRFRADIKADDLDKALKASRETVEESRMKDVFRDFLRELFNEANSRYDTYLSKQAKSVNKEGVQKIVPPRLVEYPVADALITQRNDAKGAEADEGWFYIDVPKETDFERLLQDLYHSPRSKYTYAYTQNGTTSRLVKFEPTTATFWINEDHDFVREYADEGSSILMLEDFVTAEALLEVYLRENQVPPHIIGQVLERRDELLRSLVKDHTYSLKTISTMLKDSSNNDHELEISLVVAMRALGFVATHIAGPGEPDGIARFIEYSNGEKKITLEAKSSDKVPSLHAIDFAGLSEHVGRHNADGCLLIAPSYPGDSKEDNAAAYRAIELRISCWTVEQLANFIEVAESRQLAAKDVLKIVMSAYSPDDVSKAVSKLLSDPDWDTTMLYRAVLEQLRFLDGKLLDSLRTVDMITGRIIDQPGFGGLNSTEPVEKAIKELANASKGGMTLRDRTLLVHVSLDELERRLGNLTKNAVIPRKLSNFRL